MGLHCIWDIVTYWLSWRHFDTFRDVTKHTIFRSTNYELLHIRPKHRLQKWGRSFLQDESILAPAAPWRIFSILLPLALNQPIIIDFLLKTWRLGPNVSTRTECVKVGFVQNSCFPPFLVSRSSSVAVFTNCKLAFSLPCLYAHIKAVLISSELNGGGTIEHNIQNGVDFRTFSLVQRSIIVRLVFSGNKS
jgi:hypothetical protein